MNPFPARAKSAIQVFGCLCNLGFLWFMFGTLCFCQRPMSIFWQNKTSCTSPCIFFLFVAAKLTSEEKSYSKLFSIHWFTSSWGKDWRVCQCWWTVETMPLLSGWTEKNCLLWCQRPLRYRCRRPRAPSPALILEPSLQYPLFLCRKTKTKGDVSSHCLGLGRGWIP